MFCLQGRRVCKSETWLWLVRETPSPESSFCRIGMFSPGILIFLSGNKSSSVAAACPARSLSQARSSPGGRQPAPLLPEQPLGQEPGCEMPERPGKQSPGESPARWELLSQGFLSMCNDQFWPSCPCLGTQQRADHSLFHQVLSPCRRYRCWLSLLLYLHLQPAPFGFSSPTNSSKCLQELGRDFLLTHLHGETRFPLLSHTAEVGMTASPQLQCCYSNKP